MKLLKFLASVSGRRSDDWNMILDGMLAERRKTIPEIQVVDALKEYLDGSWGGPLEQKRLWNNVLTSLKNLEPEAKHEQKESKAPA